MQQQSCCRPVTHSGSSGSRDSYYYGPPLNTNSEDIRILSIFKQSEVGGGNNCLPVSYAPAKMETPQYEALSYRWGQESDQSIIDTRNTDGFTNQMFDLILCQPDPFHKNDNPSVLSSRLGHDNCLADSSGRDVNCTWQTITKQLMNG